MTDEIKGLSITMGSLMASFAGCHVVTLIIIEKQVCADDDAIGAATFSESRLQHLAF